MLKYASAISGCIDQAVSRVSRLNSYVREMQYWEIYPRRNKPGIVPSLQQNLWCAEKEKVYPCKATYWFKKQKLQF